MYAKEVLPIKHISPLCNEEGVIGGRAGVDKLMGLGIRKKDKGGKELLDSHQRWSLL